jgi:XTP/dITP diphosphohydrolase
MELLLATENLHKRREIEAILDGHRVLLPSDLSLDYHHDETGATYLENAMGKARSLYRAAGRPVVSDDSGLSVVALGGAPGIYSARYGATLSGRRLEAPERNALLLKTMGNETNREAFFVCCMVLMVDDYRFFVAQETLAGRIAQEPSGSGGFGYDPVFFLPDRHCTVAELDADTKNAISHRGRAGARIQAILASMDSA